MSTLLDGFFASATEPLVLIDGTVPGFAESFAASLELPDGVARLTIRSDEQIALDTPFKAMLLCCADRAALRRVIGLLPRLGNARTFGVYLQRSVEPLALMPRPEWPPLRNLTAKVGVDGDALTVVRLGGAISATPVLAELARSATSRYERGEGALVVGLVVAPGGIPDAALPPGDTATVTGTRLDDVVAAELEVPPDVVLTAQHQELEVSQVLGRAPVTLDLRNERQPVDELVVNPRGYTGEPTLPVGELTRLGATYRIRAGETDVLLDAAVGVGDTGVRDLRDVRGVRIAWPDSPAPGLPRLAAGLAMAGVPVTSPAVPAWAVPELGALADVVARPVDLDDQLRRDEHSVLLRRAAFADYSTFAWRRAIAARVGVAGPEHPSVSILLATKRPHQVLHAIRQVKHQRGVEVEVVLATHGFEFDAADVAREAGDLRVVQLAFPEDAVFGDVLTAAARAASGDLLLKFDDDDWYGPDAVTDLLMARRYSGAPVVGMPAEFLYLGPVDTTIRRTDRTEFYARFVAGGTIMIDRGLLRSVGWFRRVRKYVDLQLLTAVQAAGASIYRTHGLGYVMARSAEGHTWNPGLDYFLAEERVGTTYPGFSPSLLMELPEPD